MRRSPRNRSRSSGLRAVAISIAVLLVAGGMPGTFATAKKPEAPKGSPKAFFADFYPPSPFFIVVKQPDGTAIRAKLNAAEIGGNLETAEGYAITKESDGWWYYAASADGAKLVASKRRAGIASPKGLPRGLGRISSIWSGKLGELRNQTFRALQMANYEAQMQAAATGALPRVFKVPFLLLATWWDADAGQTSPQFQAGHDREFFEKLLAGFGGNPTGTMTEFWLENSYGQLKVEVDVYGPYTSNRSRLDRCYYGNVEPEYQSAQPNILNQSDPGESEPLDVPGVGPIPRLDDLDPAGNVLGVGGLGALGMALEAIPQADLQVDFSEYDNDENGTADFVGIIHSGPDMAATGDPCHTWSHAFPEIAPIPTTDIGVTGLPVTVGPVFTMPEVNLDIGVAVHEMMHALGEPDYYNTSYTSMGTGDWDIMAGGSWFGNPPGSNPIGANPATKVFQGWVTPTVVHGDMRDVALRPREVVPKRGYVGTQVDPNLLLIPLKWTDSTAEEDVYGLPKDPANGKYITEGWYIEHLSRSVTAPPGIDGFKRSPYFDRLALSSGLAIWHFDYFKKSNVYFGANDGQSDPNHSQMDLEEFDFNDNTQELQLNLTRGEPSDLWFGAATGLTSATRKVQPGVDPFGKPQASIEGSGVLGPGLREEYPFTVEDNPANARLKASLVGLGDCTLALEYQEADESWTEMGSIDSGFVGEAEEISIFQPKPGNWRLVVGDFLACTAHDWNVSFDLPFFTMGASDTWTNENVVTDADGNVTAIEPGVATGWAITNIGPRDYVGWEHSADAGGAPVITLDVVKLGAKDADLSPGFVVTDEGSTFGRTPINVGRRTSLHVPVFNNGGKAAKNVRVKLSTARGEVIGVTTIASLPGFSQSDARFSWTPASEGPTQLIAEVDPTNGIKEAHERNNAQATQLLVGPTNPQVLVVDDDGQFDAEDAYLGALTALGVPFAVARGHADLAEMRKYRAVIWEAGLERYQGQLDARDRDAIRKYLDGGGRFWYLSPRAAAAIGEAAGGTNPGGGTPDMLGFIRDYLGAKFVDTLQVGGGTVKGLGDAIGGRMSIETDVFTGRPVQDQFDMDESKIGKVTKVLDWSKGPAIGVKVEGDAAHKNFRAVYFGFNLAQVIDGDHQVALTRQVLDWLGVKPGSYRPSVPVVYHPQVRTRIAKQATPLKAYVFGASGPVKVLYRAHGASGWQDLAMKPGGTTGLYEATIPGVWSTLRGLDYVVVAGALADPHIAPDVAHYVGVAPPEAAAPAVAGKKFARARGGVAPSEGAPLPATGVGGELFGFIPIFAAIGVAAWLRRRRLA